MRVALVSRARGGGVHRVNVDLANLLRRDGHDVSLVMYSCIGHFLHELEPGVELVDLEVKTHLGFVLAFARYLGANRHASLLVSQHHVGALAIVASLLARAKSRLVVVVHNNVTRVLRTSALAPLYSLALRALSRFADAFVCVSAGVARDLLRHLPSAHPPVSVVYNAVSIPRLRALAEQECHEPWLVEKAGPVVLGVGRLIEQKDFASLIRAMAVLIETTPARLVLVGDGPLRDSLSALARELGIGDLVRFAGRTPNPYSLMKHADVIAVSSRWEGFSLVVLEALALGRPIVATDCDSGPSEILEGGKWGRLVPVGDARLLAAALAEAIANGGSGELGTERAAYFSEQRFLRGYLHVLEPNAP